MHKSAILVRLNRQRRTGFACPLKWYDNPTLEIRTPSLCDLRHCVCWDAICKFSDSLPEAADGRSIFRRVNFDSSEGRQDSRSGDYLHNDDRFTFLNVFWVKRE